MLQEPDALERVTTLLPAGFPQRVFKPIRTGMLAQAEKVFDELE